jgi:myosin heavy subunit
MTSLSKQNKDVDEARYRFGVTKIFFKTGVLGAIEEMREAKVASLVLTVQAAARGWHARRRYRIMHSQSDAAMAIQANVRAYIRFKKWGWWKLFCKARPLLKRRNIEKELEERDQKINELKANLQRESDNKSKYEVQVRDLQAKLDQVQEALQTARSDLASTSDAKSALQRENDDLQDQLDQLRKGSLSQRQCLFTLYIHHFISFLCRSRCS